jgi:hypothetical protein
MMSGKAYASEVTRFRLNNVITEAMIMAILLFLFRM